MTSTRIDAFLGGRVQVEQPVHGYRAGADAVMLAAACPALPGQSVLEPGCGVGTASLCLAVRVGDLQLTGIERDANYAALARANAIRNAAPLQVIEADLANLPPELRAQSFDHVIMNPPFFPNGTLSPDAARAGARHEETPLAAWLDTGLRRLRPGGTLTVIHLAQRLDQLLAGLSGRAGDITILPITARAGRDAGRIILRARKGARAPLRLLSPFIMHEGPAHLRDTENLSENAQAVLRQAVALPLPDADRG
ncbi:tRNA1(Val) (adenine(37)-N6)-methyltransferase [Paracoccus xiamenensis]|uniref:tRNA1(Val) (adenine(37)-N6)-methyltransferase n=1 Tax=Paracoccus xiamenensis TaxID=2714901 RepID=UPI00140956F4|nr:methyltransferase [Paracoccus xiamenensis]NHF73920.1 methyltransferase [Paracoccus xiamenensis]